MRAIFPSIDSARNHLARSHLARRGREAAMDDYGLKLGTPDLRSVGAITFGPEDILFVADVIGARVFAIDVADADGEQPSAPFDLENLDARLGAFLGCNREDLTIRDMAVHPRTQNVYLSVSRGKGRDAIPLIVRIRRGDASFSEVSLENVRHGSADLPTAPAEDQEYRGFKMRSATVSDMAYVDGTLFVAGMSNEEFSSNLRRIAFPFRGELISNSLEIFHVSHGRYETAAPIRTFVPYGGRQSILASYTCTPLVRFSMAELTDGMQAQGETVAELGARNAPIDMVAFQQQDQEYLLVSHSHHPLMKIAAADIDRQTPLREPRAPVGAPFQALAAQGVTRLANLNGSYVLMMQRDPAGSLHLHSVATSAL
jgi:hypothetical protein